METCKLIAFCSQIEIDKIKEAFFIIKNEMSCNVRDLIYVISCNGCGEKYIGESGDTLTHRTALHGNHTALPQYWKLFVNKHIAECAKSKSPEFTIVPFSNHIIRTKLFETKKKATLSQNINSS